MQSSFGLLSATINFFRDKVFAVGTKLWSQADTTPESWKETRAWDNQVNGDSDDDDCDMECTVADQTFAMFLLS